MNEAKRQSIEELGRIFLGLRYQATLVQDVLNQACASIDRVASSRDIMQESCKAILFDITSVHSALDSLVQKIKESYQGIKDEAEWQRQASSYYGMDFSYYRKNLELQNEWVDALQKSYVKRMNELREKPERMRMWFQTWQNTAAVELRSMIERVIGLYGMISEFYLGPNPYNNQNQQRNQRQHQPMPLTAPGNCPSCGVKNPIGRAYCLRCHTALN